MSRLYIDTNITIDAVEGGKNRFGKNIGNAATDLFFATASCKHDMVLSTWMLHELYNNRNNPKTPEETEMLFAFIKNKIISIKHTEEDIAEAKNNNTTNFQDELHGMLALRAGADYIVTRNTQDFRKFKDRIQIVKPEELL